MDWQIIVALVVMIPVILAPLLIIWFLNLNGPALIARWFRGKRSA